MLSAYRVLDLTNQNGMFCGYMLAHLGAEVIAIEPTGGSSARRVPPLSGDGESLWWHAYARGKTSLELDLESTTGRAELRAQIANADVVIESFDNKTVERYGLDYKSVTEDNPRIVLVSISPFGRTGPKADWPATDLTVWAACGAHALAGDDDRAPVRTSVPQAFLHAGADAACATLIALHERQRSGLGQHVDVSAQQSSAQASLSAILATPNNGGTMVKRAAGGLSGIMKAQLTWPCADGYVAITFLFGPAFAEPNRRLLRWVQENGECTQEDVERDWASHIMLIAQGAEDPDEYYELCKKIEAFTLQHTQQELFEEGLARGVYIAPTFDIEDLLAEPHFIARNFWHEINVSGATKAVRVPGEFARFSRSPLSLPGDAPMLGGATVSKRQQASLPEHGATDALPLSGLKVLDFMWVIAGPFCTRVLADYGATVIKVESTSRMEPARASPTFKDGEPGMETSIPFANFNAGKMGITINPANPIGRDVILDLVRWADVVTESFSPKAMKAWGLDYESLLEVNPSLIMLSSCLMGQTGPRSKVPGYGNMAAAITGFYDLTGWQDRSPAGPYLAYTDGVSPRFMLASLLAAVEHRRQTGEGQHIDVSQAEAAIHLLAPAILEHEINGNVWHRMGNRDLQFCPHGVYPTAGDDRWIAIACQSDEAWQALCKVAGFDHLAKDNGLTSASDRRAREDEIDRLISHWTASQDEIDLQARLIETNVAAHVVQNSPECMHDIQLLHRGHFASVTHSSVGELIVEGTRFKLSRTPAHVEKAGPELGEHNVQVLTDILGYDSDRMADIYASLAME